MTGGTWQEFWRRWFGKSGQQSEGDVWRCTDCRRPLRPDAPEPTIVDGAPYCDDSCYREHLLRLM